MTLMFVLLVTVGMGAAVGARMLTHREPAAAKPAVEKPNAVPFVVMKPSGKQAKLTRTVRSRTGEFTVKVPAKTVTLPEQSETSVLALSLRGYDMSALLVANKLPDEGLDPVASLRGNLPDDDPKVVALRRTEVAGMPAATTDRGMKGKQRIRQFRFVHDGVMYAAAISYDAGDRAALDTLLAVLATWKWTAS